MGCENVYHCNLQKCSFGTKSFDYCIFRAETHIYDCRKGSHCVETTKPQAFWDCNSSIEGNMNQHCVSIEGALRCADKMAPCIAGCAWFDRELQVLQEEGQLFGEWREPSFLLRGASGLPTYITP